MPDQDIHALADALDISADRITPLETTGLAHRHYRIRDSEGACDDKSPPGKLARVPVQSQHGHLPADNLAYQAMCFQTVGRTGRAPALYRVCGVSDRLPFGALIVEEITGRHARLPDDLPELARCLGDIHAAPARPAPPMSWHDAPVAALKTEIAHQAAFLDTRARIRLRDELDWLEKFNAPPFGTPAFGTPVRAEPVCLVCTDTHPGNFLITPAGKAVIVDLEKALFGSPSIDLAHASVYTSTTWDLKTTAELTLSDLHAFYAAYLDNSPKAEDILPWLIPMRRMLILRALTWCAMWQHKHRQTTSGRLPKQVPDTLTQHVAERTAHYLQNTTIDRMLTETAGLNFG